MSNVHIGIGLLGFGTVGVGLYSLLQKRGKGLQAEYGVDFEIKRILVRNPKKSRVVSIPKNLLSSSFDDFINDKSIDVIVEVMGGEKPAEEYILSALKAGKSVITANKSLMAISGEKLVARARQYSQYFGYFAAVTGSHQFCGNIANSVLIKSLAGVFNSTSNFILTRMHEGNLSFEEALKEAQVNGYAEADPAADVDGIDTCNKLVILSRLAYGIFLDRDKIPVKGIRNVSKLDMFYAKQLGYNIKLLGISRPMPDGKIEARVCPCFVPLAHPLASVRGIENGLQVHDEFRGVQTIIAEGAGANPTAAALMRDLLALAKKEPIVWTAQSREHSTFKYAKPHSTVRKFYVRLDAENKPGVLASISKVFAKHGINITRVIQDESPGGASLAPVVIMCSPTEEKNIIKALGDIEALKVVAAAPQFVRVEDALHVDDGI